MTNASSSGERAKEEERLSFLHARGVKEGGEGEEEEQKESFSYPKKRK